MKLIFILVGTLVSKVTVFEVQKTHTHQLRVTVWCSMWSGGIIGPYFFKSERNPIITVNGDTYRTMITDFFITVFYGTDVHEVCFQQDGETLSLIDLLLQTFDGCTTIISRNGDVNRSLKCCGMTPLDYFL